MSTESIQRATNQNIEYQNHLKDMRKESETFKKEFSDTVNKNEAALARLESDYKDRIANTQNDLEKQLNRVRTSADAILKAENHRLQTEIEDLKKAHHDKYLELKNNHETQIENMKKYHSEFLESAERKFEKEKSKVNG